MKKILFSLMVLAVVIPAGADYYIAGDFNGWNSAGQLMIDNGDGTYSATVSGLVGGARHEFKVTQGTWDWSRPGANSWFYADEDGSITITYNSNWVSDGWKTEQDRIGLSTDPGNWTIAGSFQGWDNANPATAMTSLGGGIYLFSQLFTAGEYWFKPVVTGTWDSIAENERSVGTWDMYVNLPVDSVLKVYVDSFGGVVRTEIVPEPTAMLLLGIGSLLAIRRK